MLFPEYLQTVLDVALLEVQNHPEYQLSAETRIEIYIAFGEYDSNNNLGRKTPVRGYLALKTAKRVIHNWDYVAHRIYDDFDMGNFEYDKPLSNPQKVHYLSLMVCEDFLADYISMDTISYVSGCIHHQYAGLSYYVRDLIALYELPQTGANLLYQGFYAFDATYRALQACMGIRLTPTVYKSGYIEIKDTAFLAMKSECEKDKAKALIFWTWWLTEAIPQVWEQVHGTENIDDSC